MKGMNIKMKKLYMDNYNFYYKKKFNDNEKEYKKKIFEYSSQISLSEFENKISEDFFVFHFLEENISVKVNNKSIEFPELFLYEIFSSLILCLDKKSFYCKAINKNNILYRFGIIEKACKSTYKVKREIDDIKEMLLDEEDIRLFYNTNELRAIKCLFGNPYFKNENFSVSEKGFYLNEFIKNISIPVKINEKIENENVEITGEIDELKMKESNFFQKIKEEYGLNIKNYEFSYKLKIIKNNKQIKYICIEIELRINDRFEIVELNEILGKGWE